MTDHCPSCGQALPEMRLGVRLTPLKARIFDAIAIAFHPNYFLVVMATLMIQTGLDERRRYVLTGYDHQTRMSMWLGATPHDAVHAYLLRGWEPE